MSSEWNRVALRDCATWYSGGTPSTNNPDFWGGDIPWISAASLTEFRIRSSDRRLTPLGATSGTRLVPEGATLFVVRGMSLKSEFRIGVAMRQVAFGQDCKALIPVEGIDALFLAYAVKGRTEEILGLVDEASHGTGRLSTDAIEELEIDVPALDEQRRIAGVLGALDDKIEHNRSLAQSLTEVVQRLYAARFSRNRAWPSGWLRDLCTTQYGFTASATEESVGPKFLRVMDINKRRWIDWAAVPYCEIDSRSHERYRLTAGDIVVARMADPGKSAIVEDDVDAVFASYLVRLKTPSLAHAYYVFGFLQSSDYVEYATSATTGSVQKNMNAKVIVAAGLPIPPEDEIQRHLEEVLPIRLRLSAAIRESGRLVAIRDALLPKLVTGKIRVPESYDPE